MKSRSPGQLAQIACLLEVTARKPGNIHRFADFSDSNYLDFLLSASAVAGPLDRVRELGVGRSVLEAVKSTRQVVSTNTNLGMILLMAPLAAVPEPIDWPAGLDEVLSCLTMEDAREVYRAIRLAQPGGLGVVAEQDVAGEPTVPLLEAMRMAADRDLVARQYAGRFAEVFDIALPTLRASLVAGRPLETAIISTHLKLISGCLDTLIVRKCGADIAAEASRRAAEVLSAGWPDASPDPLPSFDTWLRADGHARNPGATADLVAAALFVALREGTILLPSPANPAWWAPIEESIPWPIPGTPCE
ncbi:triphosphoribosyl-dephospho-CoA synthase [soil metagenome]